MNDIVPLLLQTVGTGVDKVPVPSVYFGKGNIKPYAHFNDRFFSGACQTPGWVTKGSKDAGGFVLDISHLGRLSKRGKAT